MSDDLIFPNNRSVKRAKADAKALARAEGLKLHEAQDRIAEQYGMKGFTWAEAVEHLSKRLTITLKCPWCGLDGKLPVVGVANWQELPQMAVECTKCQKMIGVVPSSGTVNCVPLETNNDGELHKAVDGPMQMIVMQDVAEYEVALAKFEDSLPAEDSPAVAYWTRQIEWVAEDPEERMTKQSTSEQIMCAFALGHWNKVEHWKESPAAWKRLDDNQRKAVESWRGKK